MIEKFREWGFKHGEDYALWYGEGGIGVAIYQTTFKKIGYWAGRGDQEAERLMNILLNNAASKRAKEMAEEYMIEGKTYGKYGVPPEMAEEFGFWFESSERLSIKFETTNEDEFKKKVNLLKEFGLEEGKDFFVKKTEKTYLVRVSEEGLEKIIAKTDEKATLFVNYLRARAEMIGNEKFEETVKTVKAYMKYGVSLEEARRFAFSVRHKGKGDVRIDFNPHRRDKFNEVVALLEKIGLKRGEDFSAAEPKDGKQGYVSIRISGRRRLGDIAGGREKAGEEAKALAQKLIRYIYAMAEVEGKDALKLLIQQIGWVPDDLRKTIEEAIGEPIDKILSAANKRRARRR